MSIRLLILSDTHDSAFPDPSLLPATDVVVHCGDLTMIGGLSNYRRALENLASCPSEVKLVIPGNHDVSLDAEWWAENLDEDDDVEEPLKARALFDSVSLTSQGVRFLDEGVHTIKLKDERQFTVYASPYTPSFGGYAFGYDHGTDRFNKGHSAIPTEAIDLVMTHGPPSCPDIYTSGSAYSLDIGHGGEHHGCPKLWTAISRVRPKIHCFGHVHEGYGAQVVTFDKDVITLTQPEISDDGSTLSIVAPATLGKDMALLVNAALQVHGKGENNKPWVVSI